MLRCYDGLRTSLVVAMTAVTQMKCACESCLCIVSPTDAVQKDGQYYCGDACADGHPAGQGCGHTGCQCHA